MSDQKILAIVTLEKERVAGGSPIFVVDNREELERQAFTLEKILDAMVHEVAPTTFILVRHSD
ncbi:hypothetical protein [Thermoactinomyces sp. DSM 45892]|uniref:capping complex subunit for YIEGIA n=1 Tax=Thermoactinomyces sp. DSM 45892 TaxID=1882753 RepID=UPI00089561A9|nr:hypothetical protein [Thermoactinomyces sp. DSM 45892]SDZ10373.1 hypothetical protein SAMN05444416_113102 [Thermoactinomyces sp. DSM 45892]